MTASLLALDLLLFALGAAAAIGWISERVEKKYHLAAVYSPNTLLIVSLSFVFTYFILMFSALIFYDIFYYIQFSFAAAILLYGSLKERQYRSLYNELLEKKKKEAEKLEKAVAEDPSNSAFWERLSELYSARGRKKEAIDAAQKAVALRPDTANKWLLDRLLE